MLESPKEKHSEKHLWGTFLIGYKLIKSLSHPPGWSQQCQDLGAMPLPVITEQPELSLGDQRRLCGEEWQHAMWKSLCMWYMRNGQNSGFFSTLWPLSLFYPSDGLWSKNRDWKSFSRSTSKSSNVCNGISSDMAAMDSGNCGDFLGSQGFKQVQTTAHSGCFQPPRCTSTEFLG